MKLVLALALLAAIACQSAQPVPAAACPWTNAKQRPPDQAIEVMRAGTNPPITFEEAVAATATQNWAGKDGVWVSLPPDGRVTWGSPKDGSKFWAYSLVPGHVTATARRLGGSTPTGFATSIGGQGSNIPEGPGFLPSGLTFPANGCWEVTYRVGASALTFVVDVDRP
jgi:hypothetical protein